MKNMILKFIKFFKIIKYFLSVLRKTFLRQEIFAKFNFANVTTKINNATIAEINLTNSQISTHKKARS